MCRQQSGPRSLRSSTVARSVVRGSTARLGVGLVINARALIPVSSVVKTTRGTGTTEPQPMLAGRVRLHRPLQLARSHRTQMKFFRLFSQLNCTGSLIQSALHVCRSVGGVLSAMCSCPQPHSCRRAFGLEEGDTASALVHSTWSIVPHMTQRSCLSSL